MTTINFPSTPTVGQQYTFETKTWEWNGTGWIAVVLPRASDAQLRDRTTHTGVQAISTITGLEAALASQPSNNQTGTSYTAVLADAGKCIYMNNAAANTMTVPPNSSVAYPVDTIIFVSQEGAGATTIVAGSGVTINTNEGLKVGGQHKTISLVKRATDTWVAIGTTA